MEKQHKRRFVEDNINSEESLKQNTKKIICIVSFSDIESNSLAYKKFNDIDKAVEFYRAQLEKDDVNVISTRKTILK